MVTFNTLTGYMLVVTVLLSSEYAELLLARARRYIESAKTNLASYRFDVAAVEAEIAAQPASKALMAKLGFETPRIHRIRELLSMIAGCGILPDGVSREVKEFVKKYREKLIILERARIAGQYGVGEVEQEEAEIAVETADEVIRLVEQYWRLVG